MAERGQDGVARIKEIDPVDGTETIIKEVKCSPLKSLEV